MEKLRPLALISVYDKTGIGPFAKVLAAHGYRILSTGGTSKYLQEQCIAVEDVSDFTGSPSILDGRVKTLHPKIHGGILFDRNSPSHCSEAQHHQIESISLVVVNLYPFTQEAVEKNLPLDKAIEYCDIGGPTMLRAAAKNWQHCLAVTDPADYEQLGSELQREGKWSERTRLKLAQKTFAKTSDYDARISAYFSKGMGVAEEPMPSGLGLSLKKVQDLRYGENPHQKAAYYQFMDQTPGIDPNQLIQGKALSYNNLLDLNAGLDLISEFSEQTAVGIIKHTNPCGCATGDVPLLEVYERALEGDPISAFGGIVAVNTELDGETAAKMSSLFLECIVAPSFSQEALDILAKKKNLRLLKSNAKASQSLQFRSVQGGLLVQESDYEHMQSNECELVTQASISDQCQEDLRFAMKVACHVKSNGIVFAKDGRTISIGAGQMSRIDAVEFAASKAEKLGKDLKGAVLASDAFFPFRDCVDLAAKLGIKGIIQPGGSIKDKESIEAANEAGIGMMFTGIRHFRH
ncbi:MAG: bifunctional phosphoribosylaminoimidazolecarboxamide formyltransferase/IMP cyclohydrolase [Oligoflexales bacterium]|nr:bifunctional phosphoribosylaminoimidazolecarboxamide formyltransferase/IMP cyclohydrolase [Oligoflexales bacterium]